MQRFPETSQFYWSWTSVYQVLYSQGCTLLLLLLLLSRFSRVRLSATP